jgi:hypothetical protein
MVAGLAVCVNRVNSMTAGYRLRRLTARLPQQERQSPLICQTVLMIGNGTDGETADAPSGRGPDCFVVSERPN